MRRRPRPVLTRAGIAGAVTSVAGLASWLGYSDLAAQLSGQAQTIGAVAVVVLGFVPHVIAAKSAESKVTPLTDPRDNAGNLLSTVGDIVSAAVAGEAADIAPAASVPAHSPDPYAAT